MSTRTHDELLAAVIDMQAQFNTRLHTIEQTLESLATAPAEVPTPEEAPMSDTPTPRTVAKQTITKEINRRAKNGLLPKVVPEGGGKPRKSAHPDFTSAAKAGTSIISGMTAKDFEALREGASVPTPNGKWVITVK